MNKRMDISISAISSLKWSIIDNMLYGNILTIKLKHFPIVWHLFTPYRPQSVKFILIL